MTNDPIADMFTRIRNGYMAKKAVVTLPASKIKVKIGEILAEAGYLEKVEVDEKGKFKQLKLSLRYRNGRPALTQLKRTSKPGRRLYQGFKKLPKVLGGLGIAIVSTSQGLMTAETAKKKGLGGEILGQAW